MRLRTTLRGSFVRPTCIVLAGLAALIWAPSASAYIYWTNWYSGGLGTGSVGRANLDGSGANQGFILGASGPSSVAVDTQHIYWGNAQSGTIGRAGIDGSSPVQSFIGGVTGEPYGLDVDPAHVYWNPFGSMPSDEYIGRADLDGSAVNQKFISLEDHGYGIAVDSAHMYWSTVNSPTIWRANLDGSQANKNFISTGGVVGDIAVDSGHIYWSNNTTNAIGRAELSGSSVNQNFISTASKPWGVAVDAGHVYWTAPLADTIGRANLDGSNVTPSFVAGAHNPQGIAVDGLVPSLSDTPVPPATQRPPPDTQVPAPADTSVVIKVSAKRSQKATKLEVTVSCGVEACTISSAGKVLVNPSKQKSTHRATFRLKPARARAGANQAVALRLKPSKKKLAALLALIHAGATANAAITVTATDAARNTTKKAIEVRLEM